MDIAEVVKRSGLPASTLRYYEKRGLIKSNGRNGLRRLYNPKVLEQLDVISLGRIAGLSLEQMTGMFDNQGKAQIDRELLVDKANEIEQTIVQLMAARDGLLHVANCPAPNHFECPKFKKLLKHANRHIRK